jgi:hypothetical protein
MLFSSFFFFGGVYFNSTFFLGLKSALASWVIREKEIRACYRGDDEVSFV